MELIASGRDADVYAYADGLVTSTIVNNLIYGYDDYGIVLYQID